MKQIFLIAGLISILSCSAQNKGDSKSNSFTNSDSKTIIVDVRTVEEWKEGHAPCSVNYPLDMVTKKAQELKKFSKVVIVCKSGGRAGNAKTQLEALGVKNIENLGAWQNIKCK